MRPRVLGLIQAEGLDTKSAGDVAASLADALFAPESRKLSPN